LTEQDIQNQIMLALSKHGAVFRTNAGDYWQGERVFSQEFKQQVLINLRKVSGLPRGFTDLLVICNGGMAAFIEVKTKTGRPTPEQLNFIEQMKSRGCKAGVARSPEDAIKIILED